MLAAATENSTKHDVIKRTLMMVSSGKIEVSDPVREYFNQVLSQAKELLQNPGSLNKYTYPESIEFAIELINHSDLLDEMVRINGINDVSAPIADKLLKAMKEHNAVHQD